ncbi:uncharacterized protein LOC125832788 [Solanum verrucosum]|uniref:uncharacterized protein LOC125832788 n=1 Tax=Solanum verrucosum TaxID=315347 RepID=UPI0020D02579|nr:uncharacterized protein LOC125832788 [Solanum verrucosum]
MVVHSRAQIRKFLCAVSDLIKTECRNAMLLGVMDISRIMTHAQHIDGDKVMEMAKDNKKARTGNCNKNFPTCPKCGKNHPRECLVDREGCFGCGQYGHRLKDFPSPRLGKSGKNNRAKSTAPAAPVGRPTQQGS